MIRFKTKMLSVLLAIVMFFTFVPNSVYAAIADAFNTDEIYNNSTIGNNDSTKEAYAIGEDISKRTENAKYIRMSDGSYYVAMYDNAVHYQDENGDWQDIDNTLSESAAVDSDDVAGVATSKGKHTVKFANNSNSSKLVAIKQDKYKISFNLVGANKSKAATVTNPAEHAEDATELEKITVLNKMISSVKYADILAGVDLEYVVSGNDVKENIIVKEKAEAYVYQFDMKLNKLVAETQNDGTIALKDDKSGEVVYTIAMPYMFDANGEHSKEVTYTLEQINNKEYRITVTADAEWINADGRAFPVTIDPPVGVSTSSVTDLDICSTSPSTNFNPSTTMYVGTNWRCYWKTNDLPDLPASAHIISASISLKRNSGDGQYVGAYQVISDWDETLTWNDTISATSQGVMSDTVIDYNYILSSGDNWFSWNITNVVKEWYSDESLNYGIGFKLVSETTASGNAIFLSSEYSTEANRPRFTIVYKDIKGIESYWTYGNQNAGFAGTGYVNYATGNLIFGKSLLSTTDSLMSYAPSLIYNSSLAGKDFTYSNAQSAYSTSYAPTGFKFSISETLIKKSIFASNGDPLITYVLSDEDGTEHYFLPIDESTTKYQDEDGLQLELNVSDTQITITDNSKSVRVYKKCSSTPVGVSDAWYLESISDDNGNKILFYFEDAKPRYIKLVPNSSAAITYLTILYGSNGLPSVIYNNASKEAMLFRYSVTPGEDIAINSDAKYLKKIEYAHSTNPVYESTWNSFYQNSSSSTIFIDATASYIYDDNGYLTEVKDEFSGYRIKYNYNNDNNDNKKVELIEEFSGNSIGQKVGIAYFNEYTEVRSSGSDDIYNNTDDIITRYIFDAEGRVTSMYSTDTERKTIYGASSGVYETQDNVKNNLKSTVVLGGSTSNYILNGGFEDSTRTSASHWSAYGDAEFTTTVTSSLDNVGERNALLMLTDNSYALIRQCITLDKGKYTLSAVFNTLNCQNVNLKMNVYPHSDRYYEEEIPLNESSMSGELFTYTLNFEAETDGEVFEIEFLATSGDVASSGAKIYIDNVSVEKNVSASNYSMLQYGNFEDFYVSVGDHGDVTYIDDRSDYWNGTNYYFTTDNYFGNVCALNGNITSKSYVKQRIPLINSIDKENYDRNGAEYWEANYPNNERTFIVSGFAKGVDAIDAVRSKFAIRVDINYYQGCDYSTYEDYEYEVESYYFEFSADCDDWQFASGSFDTAAGKLVHSIDIVCDYSYQPYGTSYFDEVSVIESIDNSVVKYEYYANGLLATKTSGYYEEFYIYNDAKQLVRKANNRGELTDYTYVSETVNDVSKEITYDFFRAVGEAGKLTTYPFELENADDLITKTPRIVTDYSYDNYGLMTGSSTYEAAYSGENIVAKSGSQCISHYYEYETSSGSRIFGALVWESDNLGVYTDYYYDESNGRLLAVVNSDQGTGTCYEYDAIGNITAVYPADVSAEKITDAENVKYTYDEANRLSGIESDSTKYTFTYDAFGNSNSVSIGNNRIVNYEYNANNGKLKQINYENNFSVKYVYDTLDNIKEVWYINNGISTLAYEYTYTAYGQLLQFDNKLTGKSSVYKYDRENRLIAYSEFDSEDMANEFAAQIFYNDRSEVSMVSYRLDYTVGSSVKYLKFNYYHSYNSDGTLNYYSVNTAETGGKTTYSYDAFNRLTTKVHNFYLTSDNSKGYTNTVSYTFLDSPRFEDRTSSLVETFTSQVGNNSVTYTYSYDYAGNVTKITTSDGNEYRYVYDDLNQLVREDNTAMSRTYVYTYDNAGNILTKKTYAITAASSTPSTLYTIYNYSYTNSNWGDQLTSYKGMTITYDAVGNPLTYSNGSTYTFTWKNGRQLATAVKGSYTLSFEYNDEGIRTSKTVNGVEHIYRLVGSQIVTEEWGNNLIIYLYDAEGAPIGMQYRNTSYAEGAYDTYWFEKNLQGDIVAVYSETGTKLIAYAYDAWGNFSTTYYNGGASTTATYNPFRYRGYYYDAELGFYYLNSRYYDPAIGRFINPDDVSLLGANGDFASLNLYAYCGNNPVARADDGGEAWNFVIGAIVGGIVGGVSAAIESYITTGSVSVSSTIVGIAVGAASGLVAASGLTILAQAGISAGISAMGSIANQTCDIIISDDLTYSDFSIGQVVKEGVSGGLASIAGSLVGNRLNELGGITEKANIAFNNYLNKQFTANIRNAAGKSSSALLRQANKFLAQTKFYDNLGRGVSSVAGSLLFGW